MASDVERWRNLAVWAQDKLERGPKRWMGNLRVGVFVIRDVSDAARIALAVAEWREHFARQPEGEVSFTQAQAASLAWEAFDCAMRGEGPGQKTTTGTVRADSPEAEPFIGGRFPPKAGEGE
jgi:hypothetical protein